MEEAGAEEKLIFETIKKNLLAVVPEVDPKEVSADRSMAELGCNSIDRAEVVTLTMEDLKVTVPIVELGRVKDIGTLIDLLRRYL
jgi:polyketide biosynthesis acyl carrier protein